VLRAVLIHIGDAMLKRAKITFLLAAPFLLFFVVGITDKGQEVLRGRIPPNATHWQLDDIYMGAGLAPVAYGLLPALLLCVVGFVFLFFHWRTKRVAG
jgi:hypothetical protein